jgi:L-amino acid N-acyltransferase YncA
LERLFECNVTAMNTVQEIKAAIEKLSPPELRELVAWIDERQASLNASDALFQAYDREE